MIFVFYPAPWAVKKKYRLCVFLIYISSQAEPISYVHFVNGFSGSVVNQQDLEGSLSRVLHSRAGPFLALWPGRLLTMVRAFPRATQAADSSGDV